jgi:hypothetical protein
MKALFTSVSVLLITGLSYAQNVQYKVTRDDPGDINNFWMQLDLAQMDISYRNIDGASFNIGLTGLGLLGNEARLGFDYTARYGWLTMSRLVDEDFKRALQFEAGGLLKLFETNKVKNAKIVLDKKDYTNRQGNQVTEYTYITIPANFRKIVHARGGVYFKRNPLDLDAEDVEAGQAFGRGNLVFPGIYVGLSSMRVRNVYVSTDIFGRTWNSGISRFYADVIIVPTPLLDGSRLENAKPLGFRFGYSTMAADVKKNVRKGGFGTQVEVGIRPVEGIYVTGTLYFTIMRRKLSALGYKPREGANDNGQIIEKE